MPTPSCGRCSAMSDRFYRALGITAATTAGLVLGAAVTAVAVLEHAHRRLEERRRRGR